MDSDIPPSDNEMLADFSVTLESSQTDSIQSLDSAFVPLEEIQILEILACLGRDFTRILPAELVYRIFGYLPQHDIMNISLVSTTWLGLTRQAQNNSHRRVRHLVEDFDELRPHMKRTPNGLVIDAGKGFELLDDEDARPSHVTLDEGSDVGLYWKFQNSFDAVQACKWVNNLVIHINTIKDMTSFGCILPLFSDLKSLAIFTNVCNQSINHISLGRERYLSSLRSLILSPVSLLQDDFWEDNGMQQVYRQFLLQTKCKNLKQVSLRYHNVGVEALRKVFTPKVKIVDISDFRRIPFSHIVEAARGKKIRLRTLRYFNTPGFSLLPKQELGNQKLEFISDLKELALGESSLTWTAIVKIVTQTRGRLSRLVISTPFWKHVAAHPDAFGVLLRLCPKLSYLSVGLLDETACELLAEALHKYLPVVVLKDLHVEVRNVSVIALSSLCSCDKVNNVHVTESELPSTSTYHLTDGWTEKTSLQ